MVKLLAHTTCFLFVGLFGSCAFSSFATKQVRDQRLIALAKQEITRRHLPLPADYTTVVAEVVSVQEIPPYSRYFYGVTFYKPTPKHPVRLYTVTFDRPSGRLHDFSDRRDEVTSEEIAAAKRAMIQHVGGTPDQFSTGCSERGDTVEFTILDLRGPSRRSARCFVRRKTLEVIEFKLLPPTI